MAGNEDPSQKKPIEPLADDPNRGKKPDTPGEQKTETPPASGGDKTFTQADVDRIVTERLEREKSKSEKDAKKIKDKAEADALVAQQEWQKLAEKRAKEVEERDKQLADLEPIKAKAERYGAALKKYLDAQRAGLPDHILALLDKLEPADQIEYIATNRDKLVTTPAGQGDLKKPVPPTPKPGDPQQVTQEELEKRRKTLAAQVRSYF